MNREDWKCIRGHDHSTREAAIGCDSRLGDPFPNCRGLCFASECLTPKQCAQREGEMTDSERAELRTAVSAVLYGSVWGGFNGPTGVTKDEALDYASVLARWVHKQIEPRDGDR